MTVSVISGKLSSREDELSFVVCANKHVPPAAKRIKQGCIKMSAVNKLL